MASFIGIEANVGGFKERKDNKMQETFERVTERHGGKVWLDNSPATTQSRRER
jgi:hypothetical protein